MAAGTLLERVYPGAKVAGLHAVCVDGAGWYSVNVGTAGDALAIIRRGTDGVGRPIRVFNVILADRDGYWWVADFQREEILGTVGA